MKRYQSFRESFRDAINGPTRNIFSSSAGNNSQSLPSSRLNVERPERDRCDRSVPRAVRKEARQHFLNNVRTRSVQRRERSEQHGTEFEPNWKPQTFKEKVHSWTRNRLGVTWEAIQMLLSCIGVALFIYSQYTESDDGIGLTMIEKLEIGISGVFLTDIVIGLYIAPSRRRYFTQFYFWVDLGSIIPAAAQLGRYLVSVTSSPTEGFLKVLRVFRTFRVLRTYRLVHITKSGTSFRELSVLIYGILCQIVVGASIVHIIEPNVRFDEGIYFAVVTLATVGYGDLAMTSTVGRLFVCVYIVAAFLWIPRRSKRLIDLHLLSSPMTNRLAARSEPHVVVCGDFDSATLSRFLLELLNNVNYNGVEFAHLSVVVIGPSPDTELRIVLESRELKGRVSYTEGNSINHNDLVFADITTAKGCFILTRKDQQNPQKADAESVLRTLSIRKSSKSIPIFVECIMPSNKRALYDVGATVVFCSTEIRNKLLGMSCIVRGFHTFVHALISNSLPTSPVTRGSARTPKWLRTFFEGCRTQIYLCKPDPFLNGRSFIATADFVYQEYGVIVLGVRNDTDGLMLNPSNGYIVSNTDMLYVISHDPAAVADIGQKKIPYISMATHGALSDIKMKRRERTASDCVAPSTPLTPRGNKHAPDSAFEGFEVQKDNDESDAPRADELTIQLPNATKLNFKLGGRKESLNKDEFIAHEATMVAHVENMFDALRFCELDFSQLLGTGIKPSATSLHYLERPRNEVEVFIENVPPAMTGHVVVLGGVGDAYLFCLPLRSHYLHECHPIVFVTPAPLQKDQLQLVSLFERVYVVVGDIYGAGAAEVFERARIGRARSVIVLPPPDKGTKNSSHPDQIPMADFRAMINTLQIHAMYRTTSNLVTVLSHPENARFIGPWLTDNIHLNVSHPFFHPANAEGGVFNESFFEAILASCYQSPETLEFLETLMISPVFVSGRKERSAHLFMMDLPPCFALSSFQTLVQELIPKGIIPVGIYRWAEYEENNHEVSEPSHVIINPPKTMEVLRTDQLYVLAHKEPLLSDFDFSKRSASPSEDQPFQFAEIQSRKSCVLQ